MSTSKHGAVISASWDSGMEFIAPPAARTASRTKPRRVALTMDMARDYAVAPMPSFRSDMVELLTVLTLVSLFVLIVWL